MKAKSFWRLFLVAILGLAFGVVVSCGGSSSGGSGGGNGGNVQFTKKSPQEVLDMLNNASTIEELRQAIGYGFVCAGVSIIDKNGDVISSGGSQITIPMSVVNNVAEHYQAGETVSLGQFYDLITSSEFLMLWHPDQSIYSRVDFTNLLNDAMVLVFSTPSEQLGWAMQLIGVKEEIPSSAPTLDENYELDPFRATLLTYSLACVGTDPADYAKTSSYTQFLTWSDGFLGVSLFVMGAVVIGVAVQAAPAAFLGCVIIGAVGGLTSGVGLGIMTDWFQDVPQAMFGKSGHWTSIGKVKADNQAGFAIEVLDNGIGYPPFYSPGDDDADDDVDDDISDDDTELVDNGDGTATDPATGLMWQIEPTSGSNMHWYPGLSDSAVTFCQNLSYDGYNDWRLPDIWELRSLIRGCSTTETGGTCGVTETCLEISCADASCNGCSVGGGPGSSGAYWPTVLSGAVGFYWSNSRDPNAGNILPWGIRFESGLITYRYDESVNDCFGGDLCYARCVR